MTRLWIARHGATVWSETGRLRGRTPIGLSERGQRQVLRLAEQVYELRLARLLVSPTRRAWETGRIIGARCDLIPVVWSPNSPAG